MKSKAQTVAGWILSGLAGLMIIGSGIAKLSGAATVVEVLTKLGVGSYIPVLGTMEIGFAILFLIPRTMKIGFLLITCYFAGAIATELSHGGSPVNAAITLSLVWIAAFVRNPDIFIVRQSLTSSK